MADECDYSYLSNGLVDKHGMRLDLRPNTQAVALAWLAQGIDPARLEVCAEFLARLAQHLGSDALSGSELCDAVAQLEPWPPLGAFVRAAATAPLDQTAVAALAVHLLDIAEAAALQVFVPELTKLTARSDRSGNAARRVGSARHLRG